MPHPTTFLRLSALLAGNSTDGAIRALGFVALADDLHSFPPYQAVPLIREDSLTAHPEIQLATAKLANQITAEEMQTLNDAIDTKHQDVAEVVRQFRTEKGL
ncbi:MAG TPA: glycine betaine ABC transporter substrate-binding protein [Acidobacteriaceae bacterium]|nr:glycine betaine ABC transporter substrate-binding protein [Acidobacteriaceae bacterium]